MPSTERRIFRSVDGCFNRNRGKPCFRCMSHEAIEIAVRIEIRVSVLVWNHAVKRLFDLVHLKASREYPCEFEGRGRQLETSTGHCAPHDDVPDHLCAVWCQHVHSKCQQECAESLSMNNERPVTAASLFLNLAVRHSNMRIMPFRVYLIHYCIHVLIMSASIIFAAVNVRKQVHYPL